MCIRDRCRSACSGLHKIANEVLLRVRVRVGIRVRVRVSIRVRVRVRLRLAIL